MKIRITTCILALFLSSCVSVKLGDSKIASAKGVRFSSPGFPFKQIKVANSDRSWLSEKTGNTISFLSECGSNVDLSISQIETDSLSALNKVEVLQAEVTEYNGREAHKTLVTGELDGIPVQLALLVFKKNNCNYTLSYSGVKKNFASEESYFQNFINDFKAP